MALSSPYFPTGDAPLHRPQGRDSQADLLAALDRFLPQHAATTSFVAAGTASQADKALFVRSLVDALQPAAPQPATGDVAKKCLTALRILSREPEGCQTLFLPQGICTLLSFAQLSGNGTDSGPTAYAETPVALEALKCLCNVLLQFPPARDIVRGKHGVDAMAKILKDPSLPSESQFLFLRLLFLLTVDDHATVVRLLEPACDLPATLVSILRKPDGGDARPVALVGEILKTVYNLMSIGNVPAAPGARKGEVVMTLANSEVDLEFVGMFASLLPEITKLVLTVQASPPLSPPLSHAIHTLLNFPLAPYRSTILNGTEIVDRLCRILEDTIKDDSSRLIDKPPGASLDEILPPLIIVLSGIARQDLDARERIRSLLMPDDIDRSRPLDQGTSTTSRLIGFMTAIAVPNVRESVGDLLFVLCGENADRLVRYIGYGHAAGFLQARGLLSVPLGGGGGGGGGSSTTHGPQLDPITGEHERRRASADWDGMTEDEKELEAEKLMVLFEKLNRTGVIKAVVPGMP